MIAPSLLAAALAFAVTAQTSGGTQEQVRRALALIESGNPDDARPVLKGLLGAVRGEELATVRFHLGLIDTDPVNAIAEYEGAAALSSGRRAAARLAIGEIYLLTGDAETARTHLDDARRLKQGDASERAAFLRGVAYSRDGKHLEAREAFADYLIDYLEGAYQAEARLGIAAANEALGRPREAAEIYRAVLRQHPLHDDIAWALFRLSELLTEESPSEAEAFRATLEKDHAHFVAGANLIPGTSLPSEEAGFTTVAVMPASTPSTPPNAVPSTPSRPMSPRRTEPPSAPTPARASPTRSATPAAPTSSAGRYRIQAGAFGDSVNARSLAATFERTGHSTEVVKRSNLWVVFVGRFATRTQAANVAPEIERVVGHKVLIRD
jgi:TolA-binding protein